MTALKTVSSVAAALIVAAGVAGAALAAEPLDQMKPIDDASLDDVQGPVGLAKKGGAATASGADSTLSQAKTSLEGMAAVGSSNTNNTLGVGIISLNNAAEGSALSLSNSLTNGAGQAGQ